MLGRIDRAALFGLAVNAERSETRLAARIVRGLRMHAAPSESLFAAVTDTPEEADELADRSALADQVAEIIGNYRGSV